MLFTESALILRCEGWEATILPAFGANAVRLKHHDFDILRFPSHLNELDEQPYLFGMPVLLPANRTADGTFIFEGREYRLPLNEPERGNHLHGLLWNAPFRVAAAGERFASCVIENRGEYYPFPFWMTITYQLDGKGLLQHTELLNTGESAMPVVLAFHTTFLAKGTVAVPLGKRWERDPHRLLPSKRLLPLNKAEEEIAAGVSDGTRPVVGYYTAAGNRARIGDYYYEVSPVFTQWILYNADGNQGFICIEPQTNPVNGLNDPDGHLVVASGETAVFETRIYHI